MSNIDAAVSGLISGGQGDAARKLYVSQFHGPLDKQQPSFADMSSSQRSASMDATVRQVEELTRANNALNARLLTAEREHHGLLQWVVKVANEQNAQGRRLAAIERLSAARSDYFMARLRWLLTGR